jgi:hypothetical protein
VAEVEFVVTLFGQHAMRVEQSAGVLKVHDYPFHGRKSAACGSRFSRIDESALV